MEVSQAPVVVDHTKQDVSLMDNEATSAGKGKLQEQGLEALKDIVYGSAAGIVGKFIEYPFDTVKVRLQSQPDGLPLRYTGPLDCFKQSLKQDGFAGLYRGISAPLVGAAVETSSLFFSVSFLLPPLPVPLLSLSSSLLVLTFISTELLKKRYKRPSSHSLSRCLCLLLFHVAQRPAHSPPSCLLPSS
jgi:hypothetical protein